MRFLARRLNRDSTEEWQLINKQFPARKDFLDGPSWYSETLLGIALEAYLVSREKLHSCSTRGKHESRGSLHSGKTRIPREAGAEAEVDEAPAGGDVP